ncbi:MAG: protein TolQ [Deltaproteobacteria bacterium]|nr:protein TolQ [Deltaproteobacteria bacterium]
MTSIPITPILAALPGAISTGTAFGSDIIQMFVNAGLIVKIVLMILILFSVISWAIIFMKWKFFRNARQETDYFLDMFWDTTEPAKIHKECQDLTFSPVAQLFRAGYSELMRMNKIQKPPSSGEKDHAINGLSDYVERALKRTYIQQNSRLDKALSFLATTGNTAPFIGLFGTVWGIMESFRSIGMRGSASLAVVAPGISEALIATAVGLAAAIPAVVAFNHFSNKASEMRSEMETFSADFLSLVVRQRFRKSSGSK